MRVPRNQWYPVLESREVKRKPLGVERLGQRLVFWRDAEGRVHAHPDRCPHLGAALSSGRVVGQHLVCPFHGFEFASDGHCRHIPANGRQGKIPVSLRLPPYVLREAHDLIWLWWGTPSVEYPLLPYFSVLEGRWRQGTVTAEWPVHYTRAIENQLDVAHLPFVHRTTIGAGGRSRVEGPYVEANDQGIQVWVTNTRDTGQPARDQSALARAAKDCEPGLSFLFPACWLLNISSKLKIFVAFVPIHEHRTRFYLRSYHQVLVPGLAQLYEGPLGLSNRWILSQDQRVVTTQTPANSLDARDDGLIGADRAIAAFRRLQARLLKRGEMGATPDHPMPVTALATTCPSVPVDQQDTTSSQPSG